MRDYAELIKALRMCGAPTNECSKCPRYGTDNCHGVFKDAADAIEELLKEKAKLENSGKLLVAAFDRLKEKVPQWIGVEERLPEPFVSVLVQMPGEKPCPTVREGYIDKEGKWTAGMFRREPGEVTHWREMPEPPKERSEDA